MLFDDRNVFRLSKTLAEDIDKAVNNAKGLYQSRSHFIRVAIIRELQRRAEAKR